ncbi:hypothetical protein V8C86DRAFT_2458940 [Haematococcus lacustris]
MASPFAQAYGDALQELTTTELAKIKLLRDLARENLDEAKNIVAAIESHILTCPASSQLPAVYLIDLIIKSVPNPYQQLIAPQLARLFNFVWDAAAPDVRARLARTAGTWQGFVPASTLALVQAKMNSTVTPGVLAPAMARPSSQPPPLVQAQQPQQGSLTALLTSSQRIVPPAGSMQVNHLVATPQQQRTFAMLQPAVQPAALAAQPVPYQQYQQQAPMSYLPQPVQQPMVQQPTQQQVLHQQQQLQQLQYHLQQLQQPAGAGQLAVSLNPSQLATLHAGNFNGTALPPAVLQGMLPFASNALASNGQIANSFRHPASASQLQPFQPAGQPHHPAGQSHSAELLSSLANLQQHLRGPAAQLVAMSAAQPPAQPAAQPAAPAGPANSRDSSAPDAPPCSPTYELSQQGMKEFNPAAVEALQATSMATRNKFLDVQFLRNRRLQNAQHRVRHWYASAEQWLQGLKAVEDAPVSFFDDEETKQGRDEQAGSGGQPARPSLVEEDLSQPLCAISGEPFDRTYDPDTDKWYYQDAVVLSGEQAASHGVKDGSIVKIQSLDAAGAPLAVAASYANGGSLPSCGLDASVPLKRSAEAKCNPLHASPLAGNASDAGFRGLDQQWDAVAKRPRLLGPV